MTISCATAWPSITLAFALEFIPRERICSRIFSVFRRFYVCVRTRQSKPAQKKNMSISLRLILICICAEKTIGWKTNRFVWWHQCMAKCSEREKNVSIAPSNVSLVADDDDNVDHGTLLLHPFFHWESREQNRWKCINIYDWLSIICFCFASTIVCFVFRSTQIQSINKILRFMQKNRNNFGFSFKKNCREINRFSHRQTDNWFSHRNGLMFDDLDDLRVRSSQRCGKHWLCTMCE